MTPHEAMVRSSGSAHLCFLDAHAEALLGSQCVYGEAGSPPVAVSPTQPGAAVALGAPAHSHQSGSLV